VEAKQSFNILSWYFSWWAKC